MRASDYAATTRLPEPTDDTGPLLAAARPLLDAIWRDGFSYAKAGVILADFSPAGAGQRDPFAGDEGLADTSDALMATVDRINESGVGSIGFASQGIKRPWAMQRTRLSPRYTSRWDELPAAY